MIRLRVSPRMEPGVTRDGAFSPEHTLRDVRAFLLQHLGLDPKVKSWSFLMGYPYPDPKRRLRAKHATLDLPLSALDLEPPMGFVYQQSGRVEVTVFVLHGEGPTPEAPTLLAATDDFVDREAYRRRRAWMSGPEPCPPPPGLPEDGVAALHEAVRARFVTIERRYGRAPGGPPTQAEELASLIALAEALGPLLPLLPDKDALAQLAGSAGRGWEPPENLARQLFLARADCGAAGAEAVAALGEDMLRFGGHYHVNPLAWALHHTEGSEAAEALLAARGCDAAGECPIHEHYVEAAVSRFAWGAGDAEAYIARMSAVARRTWVDDSAREAALRVYDLLADGAYEAEFDALKAAVTAAKARRKALLKRR